MDHSKSSLDRGASVTLDAFCGLSPPSKVRVFPAILPNYNNKKTPWVRCISKVPGRSSIDVAGVDSVDKVYRLLNKHLKVKVLWKSIVYIPNGNANDHFLGVYYSNISCCYCLFVVWIRKLDVTAAFASSGNTRERATWRQERFHWPLMHSIKPWRNVLAKSRRESYCY